MTPYVGGSGTQPKPLEPVVIFIDGGYLRKLFTDLFNNDNIDFTRVSRYLIKLYNGYPQNMFRANLIRTYHYDGLPDSKEDPVAYAKQRDYFEAIELNFNMDVALGEAVKLENGKFRQKGVDILLAVDALSMAFQDQYESGLFLLGDRDFIPLIEAVKMAGKKTYGFFYIEKISKELNKAFDFRSAFNKEIMKTWIKTPRK